MDERLIRGITEFIKHEVMPNITDNGTKILIGTFVSAFKRDPSIIPMIEQLNETWVDAMRDSIREYGNVTITIPKVPLLSPEERKLTFTESDLERLKQYMQ